MNVSVEDQNPTRKILIVEVEPEEVAAEEKELLAEYRKHANLPGFRKGKAPDNLIKSRFKKDFRADLNMRLMRKSLERGAKESQIEIFAVVDQDNHDLFNEAGSTVRFTVDIYPDFDLPDYEGLKIQESDTSVSDEEVEQAIQQMREQRADYRPVEREAQAGDYVKCSYSGQLEGKPVEEVIEGLPPVYGKQSTTWEEAGSEDAPGVQGIIQGLVGMEPGEEKEVEETFPDDFSVEALRGKTVVYMLTVDEVREKVLPELDEEFLKSVEAESVEDLRTRIEEGLENQKKQQDDRSQRQQVQEQVMKQVDFPLPQSAVEQERTNILRDYMQRALQQGASAEDFEQRQEEMMQSAGKAAEERVKLRLVLSAIAEKEGVEVSNEDLSSMVMRQAMMERRKPDELVRELQKDRGRIDQLRQEILLGKTIDLLQDKAEKEAAPAETAEV